MDIFFFTSILTEKGFQIFILEKNLQKKNWKVKYHQRKYLLKNLANYLFFLIFSLIKLGKPLLYRK